MKTPAKRNELNHKHPGVRLSFVPERREPAPLTPEQEYIRLRQNTRLEDEPYLPSFRDYMAITRPSIFLPEPRSYDPTDEFYYDISQDIGNDFDGEW